MTTIDTTIDAPVDPGQLAGTPNSASDDLERQIAQSPAIAADFYNLTEEDGWPVGGLLVMLDRGQQPVRAEVQLNANVQKQRLADALESANQILIHRYSSFTEEGSHLPLQIVRVRQEMESLEVRLNVEEALPTAATERPTWINRANIALATLSVLLIAAVTFGVLALQGRFGAGSVGGPAAAEPQSQTAADTGTQTASPAAATSNQEYMEALTAAPPGTDAVMTEQPAPATDVEAPETVVAAPVQGAKPVADVEYVNPFPFETNDLAASEAAYDFSLLDWAVVSATALAVQSIPDPADEHSVHWLTQGTQVELLGGPVWKPGEGDTIVWWFARAENGKEGWMAANGGNGMRYLEPAP